MSVHLGENDNPEIYIIKKRKDLSCESGRCVVALQDGPGLVWLQVELHELLFPSSRKSWYFSTKLIIYNTRLSTIFQWPIPVNVAYCFIVCECEVMLHILPALWCIRHGAAPHCTQRNRELSHMQPHHKSNCNSQINCSVTLPGAPASLSLSFVSAGVCVCVCVLGLLVGRAV